MNVSEVPDGSVIADCYSPLTATSIAWLLANPHNGAPVTGVGRYHDNLSKEEIALILGAGLGLITVGVARDESMHAPNGERGREDAGRAIANLLRLELPWHTTALDVEGTTTATRDLIDSYCNEWARIVVGQYEPMLYEGWGIPLTGGQLYTDLELRLYWASATSSVPPEPRGFALLQSHHTPAFDYSTAQADHLGSRVHWVKA